MAENSELEDLDQLVSSPGWQRFVAMVNEQWAAGAEWFLKELDTALGTDDATGHTHFRQVRASQREIQKVLRMVPDRIKALKQPEPSKDSVMSRRGGL